MRESIAGLPSQPLCENFQTMGWSHEDSFEVRLVFEVLERLQKSAEIVNFETGEVTYGINFAREWTIPKFNSVASYKRFDFAVWTRKVDFRKPKFLIEIHGEQHFALSFLGDEVSQSDGRKSAWANLQKIPLLVLPHHEVMRLHLDGKLEARIRKFLRIAKTRPVRRN